MTADLFALQPRKRYVAGLIENIQEYLERETGAHYEAGAIERSLEIWVEARFDRILEELGEVVTSPHLAESIDFRRILDAEARRSAVTSNAWEMQPETIFNGNRAYSPERLGAMIEYLAHSGRDIYRTNLNKLLFYADLTNYFVAGRGISGATYVNMPYGPVPDGVDEEVARLSEIGGIVLDANAGPTSNIRKIMPGENRIDSDLTPDEIRTLDWVISEYGELSSSAISEMSHQEKAYASTRRGEPIAYEYAKFFHRLPKARGQ